MTIICVEEHAIDSALLQAAGPALDDEAPYIRLQNSGDAAAPARDPHHPTLVEIQAALALGRDLGPGRIAAMDQAGITRQVVSYSVPAQLAPADTGVELTRAANDRLAASIRAQPDRLSGFAALPWQKPSEAVEELERAITELGFKGALLVGRPGPRFLDDPSYEPVLARLNDLKVPLYIHPFDPVPQVQQAYYAGFDPLVTAQVSTSAWGWHLEAGVHVLRLLLSGTFERLPDLQVISGHWGEMVPYFLHRLDDQIPQRVTGLSTTITEAYRRNVWITPSGMFYLPNFQFIRDVVGLDRVIWSVDYPYLTMDGTREFIASLPISDTEKEQISHLNAERLLNV